MFDIIKELLDERDEAQLENKEEIIKDLNINNKGVDIKELKDIIKKIERYTPKTDTKRFLSQLFGGKDDIALLGDIVASILNVPMHTHKASGINVEIEELIIEEFCKKTEMRDGIITPGGSISNLMGLIMGRDHTNPEIRNVGLSKKIVAYTSDQSHYSTLKNMAIAGIGRNNLRKIETDKRGKINLVKLEMQIKKDKENEFTPFFINGTAGTTLTGSFDDISALSAIAKRENMWLHIDAAYGGGALFTDKKKHLLKNIECADSITIDAHKMLGVPLTCSIILTKQKGMLERSFREEAVYLFNGNDEPGQKTIQCARRNDALKLWTLMKYYGREGIERRINKQYELAEQVTQLIKEDCEFELALEPEHLNVCFKLIGKDEKDACQRLDNEGYKINHGEFKEQRIIKIACVNPTLTKYDIQKVLTKLKS